MGEYADDIIDSAMADWDEACFRRSRGGFHKRRAEPGSPLAKARIAAHAAFDPLWQDDQFGMTRGEAYTWLAAQLGVSKQECHMLYFNAEMCRRVEGVCMRHRFLNA